MTEIKSVGVVGCGQMGTGIASVAVEAGYRTVIMDCQAPAREEAGRRLALLLRRKGRQENWPKERTEAAQALLTATDQLSGLSRCDLVIEAATEKIAIKHQVFAKLHGLCPAVTLFASNTSSLSIAELAAGSGRPDRFLGLHFFHPVPAMKLVEVAPHAGTSPEATAAVLGFVERIGKTPLRVQDTPAFVVNALLIPFVLDAVRMAEKGTAAPEEIDRGITLGLGHPMGPFQLLDFVGIDTVISVAEIVFAKTGEARFACPPLLRRMAGEGKLGRKSGEGFYRYRKEA